MHSRFWEILLGISVGFWFLSDASRRGKKRPKCFRNKKVALKGTDRSSKGGEGKRVCVVTPDVLVTTTNTCQVGRREKRRAKAVRVLLVGELFFSR